MTKRDNVFTIIVAIWCSTRILDGQLLPQATLNLHFGLTMDAHDLEPILDLALSHASTNDSLSALQFFTRFEILHIPFHGYATIRVMRKVGKYNRRYQAFSNLSQITLMISTVPKSSISSSVDGLISAVEEANAVNSGTVSEILLSYGELELTREAVLLVNQDIQAVSTKIGKRNSRKVLLGIIIDKINCHANHANHVRNIKWDFVDMVIFAVPHIRPLGKYENPLSHMVGSIPCDKIVQDAGVGVPLEIPYFFEVFLSPFRYDVTFFEYMSRLHDSNGIKVLLLFYANLGKEIESKSFMGTEFIRNSTAFDSWLETPLKLNHLHVGSYTQIQYNKQNEALDIKAPLQSFRKFILDIRNVEESEAFEMPYKNFSRMSNFSRNAGNESIEVVLILNNKAQQLNDHHINSVLGAFMDASGFHSVARISIIFDWSPQYRYTMVQNFTEPENKMLNGSDVFFHLLQRAKQIQPFAMGATGTMPRVGVSLDRKSLLDVIPMLAESKFRTRFVNLVNVVIFFASVQHHDIVKNGAVTASNFTQELLQYSRVLYDVMAITGSNVMYVASLYGCNEKASRNLTEQVEVISFWELLSDWATKEGTLVFIDMSSSVTSEGQCLLQDKKSLALSLYTITGMSTTTMSINERTPMVSTSVACRYSVRSFTAANLPLLLHGIFILIQEAY